MCYNVKRMCIKSSPEGRGVSTEIPYVLLVLCFITAKRYLTYRDNTVFTPLPLGEGHGGGASRRCCCWLGFFTSPLRTLLRQQKSRSSL